MFAGQTKQATKTFFLVKKLIYLYLERAHRRAIIRARQSDKEKLKKQICSGALEYCKRTHINLGHMHINAIESLF